MPRVKHRQSRSPVQAGKRFACTSVRKSRTQSPREALLGYVPSPPVPKEPLSLTSLPVEVLEIILSPLDCLSLASCHAASPVLAAVISSPCFLDKQASAKLHCPAIYFRDLPQLSRFQELWYMTYCAANHPHMSLVLTRKRPKSCASPGDCNNDALRPRKKLDSPGAALGRSRHKRKPSPADSECWTLDESNKGPPKPHKTKKQEKRPESKEAGSSKGHDPEAMEEESDSEDVSPYKANSECTCLKYPGEELGGIGGVTLCGRHATLHIGNIIHSLVSFLMTAGCYPGKSRTLYPEPFFAYLPLLMRQKSQAFSAFVTFALAFPELLEIPQRSKIAKLLVHAGGPREFDATAESGWQVEQGDPDMTVELVLLTTTPGSVWLVLALAVYITGAGGLTVWTGALSYITLSTRQTFSAHGFPPNMSPSLLRQELAPSVLRILQPAQSQGLPAEVMNRYQQVGLEIPIFSSKALLINALVSHIKSTVDKMDGLCQTRLEVHELKALQSFLASLISKNSREDSNDSSDDMMDDDEHRLGIASGRNKKKKEKNTVHASITTCLRRILNSIFLEEVKWYLKDSMCHRYLCKHYDEAGGIDTRGVPCCLDLSAHKLPYKVWPPHLLCQAGHMVTTVARVLELDIVLWLQGLHSMPLVEGAHIAFIKALHHSGLAPMERDPEMWLPPLITHLELQP